MLQSRSSQGVIYRKLNVSVLVAFMNPEQHYCNCRVELFFKKIVTAHPQFAQGHGDKPEDDWRNEWKDRERPK